MPFDASTPTDRRRPTPDEPPTTPTDRRPPVRRVLTVTELTAAFATCSKSEFFEVWVEGELSNCRVWNTGHLYFTLKDAGAQIKGVMFRSALRYLKFKPEDGLRVVARGRVSRLRAEGRVSARLRAPGAAGPRRAAARVRAAEEAAAGRRAVRRGAQAAAAGAAPQDRHRHVARRRGACATSSRCCAAAIANAHLVIRPARVQGEGAALEIARGAPRDRARPRRRRRHRRPRRRLDRGSVGVQRGGRRARDRRVAGAGHLGRRPRDRRHDRRLRRRPARADAVGGRRAGRRGARTSSAARIDRLQRPAATRPRAAASSGSSRRVHVLDGAAGVRRRSRPRRDARPARRRAVARAARAIARRRVARRARRRSQQLRRAARRRSIRGRRLAGIRTRLVGGDGRLTRPARRRQHRADAQLRRAAPAGSTPQPAGGARPRLCGVLERRPDARSFATPTDVGAGDTVRVTLAQRRAGLRGARDATRTSAASGDVTTSDRPWTPSIKDFEAAIAELETIVKKLEEGDLAAREVARAVRARRAAVALLPRPARGGRAAHRDPQRARRAEAGAAVARRSPTTRTADP